MHLKRLSLTHFRAFTRLDIDFPRRIILFTGKNAQGKTTILEAIAYLANFSSFHASTDRQLLNFNMPVEPVMVGRIIGEFERQGRDHSIEVRFIQEYNGQTQPRFRKQVLLDGVQKKIGELYGQFNVVNFLPQMSRIIEGSPSDRRAYLDEILSQVEPGYARNLFTYNKALSQRNALLKNLFENNGDLDQLEAWDEMLAQHGAVLMDGRIRALDELERQALGIHHRLTRESEVLRFHYEPSYNPIAKNDEQLFLPVQTENNLVGIDFRELEKGFKEALCKNRRQDLARGVTSIGPHRDEFRFLSNGIDLGHYGSRGQTRSALLSLKFAEVGWMKERIGDSPVLLLDEIMAELDPERREDLLKLVDEVDQAMLTTTDKNMFPSSFVNACETWTVHEGLVKKDA
jgi:DNA replication and repair protein RecF